MPSIPPNAIVLMLSQHEAMQTPEAQAFLSRILDAGEVAGWRVDRTDDPNTMKLTTAMQRGTVTALITLSEETGKKTVDTP